MPRTNPAVWFALVGLGCAGCAPEPELVSITLPAAMPAQSAPLAGPVAARLAPTSQRLAIPALPHQKVFQDDATAEATAAIEAIRKSQEDNFRRLLDRLTKDALTKAQGQSLAQKQTLEDDYVRQGRAVAQRLRELFDKFADPIGRKRRELAFKVGFPDPDPTNAKAATAAITTLRREIDDLGEQYRAQAAELISGFDRDFQIRRGNLADAALAEEERVRAEAAIEANRIAFQALTDLESIHNRLTGELPAAPGVSIATSGPATPRIPKVATPEPAPPVPDLRDVFIASRGYRLSKEGRGRDVTAEFLQWQKKYKLGPSVN